MYQRLNTLKDPNQFSGWLYVITTRLCATWLRKKRIQTEPLEDVETMMTQRDVYSQHVSEERAKTTAEAQREQPLRENFTLMQVDTYTNCKTTERNGNTLATLAH